MAVSKPAIVRKIVDLPQPDGPTKTQNSPSGISKEISSIAVTLLNLRLMSSSLTFAIIRLRLMSSSLTFAIIRFEI